jgi:signal peptidase I
MTHSIKIERSVIFEDILSEGLSLRVRVTGKSMTPFLRGGEFVTLKEVLLSSVHIGDLVFWKSERGQLLLHRVIKKSRDPNGCLWIQTKGDAVKEPDAPVMANQVLGRVYRVEQIKNSGQAVCMELSAGIWPLINPMLAWLSRARVLFYRLRPYFQR